MSTHNERSAVTRRDEAPWHTFPGDAGRGTFFTDGPHAITGELALEPGQGHAFHHHPEQREVLYVIEGELTVWDDTQRLTLRAGDAVDHPAGAVHACFNETEATVRLFAVLTPYLHDVAGGWSAVPVNEEEPYASLV